MKMSDAVLWAYFLLSVSHLIFTIKFHQIMAFYCIKHCSVNYVDTWGRELAGQLGTDALSTTTKKTVRKDISGVVVSRLDYCAGVPGSIPAGPETEFPIGIQFW